MKISKSLFAFVLLCFIGNSLFAQSITSMEENIFSSDMLIELTDENWSFYKDEENKICYVDFEKIDFNLSEIIVKNEDGEILLRDDVLDLPVNTIYEIDLSEYGAGEYQIELRSFTEIIRKEVNMK
jgi:TRAP-type mannitol/chloroaromatic compound transport system permease large subunit